jgi:protein-S-isoprenylcysteine O-methyltransferase Ste14
MNGFSEAAMSQSSKAIVGVFCSILVMAVLVFGPQGRLDVYWQAWLLLAIWLAGSLAVTLRLTWRDPQLLERRMRGGPFAEKQPVQKLVMSVAIAGYVALFLISAVDHRLGWSHMSAAFAVFGDLLMLTGWWFVDLVFRTNTFAASTVEIAQGQSVISTGPYALVRHPMYAGGLIMLLGIPLALASWWGLLGMLAIVPAIVWRLFDEERLLTAELPGYAAYTAKVRHRLIPGIW